MTIITGYLIPSNFLVLGRISHIKDETHILHREGCILLCVHVSRTWNEPKYGNIAVEYRIKFCLKLLIVTSEAAIVR